MMMRENYHSTASTAWLSFGLFFLFFFLYYARFFSTHPISILLPRGETLVKPATPRPLQPVLTLISPWLISRDPTLAGLSAAATGRATDRLARGREGGTVRVAVVVWMHLPPNSYQPEQLLVGGLVWITSPQPAAPHTITSLCPSILFCWRDNTHAHAHCVNERGESMPTVFPWPTKTDNQTLQS